MKLLKAADWLTAALSCSPTVPRRLLRGGADREVSADRPRDGASSESDPQVGITICSEARTRL